HLSDPATEQDILDFLTLIQRKTTDTYIRSNAWRFSQELRELYPARYVYHEGSVVYIDAEQYEVSTINENAVSLRNVKFPLLGRDYSQDDFEKKLKENSANDYLITGMKVNEKTETPAEETPDSIAFSIEFSEHPAFYDRELNDRFTELSFALGNRLLGVLDEKQHYERLDRSKGIGWYKKTDFTIHAVIDGEEFNYEGRFDIGDGEGDLIAHIRNFYEYSLSNDCPLVSVWKQRGEDYYQKHMENLHLGQNVLLPFLEQHTKLTPEDEKLLAEIMATENDWHRNAGDKTQPGETNVIGEQLNIQEGIEKSDGESLPDFSISMIEDVLCFDEYMNHKRFDIQLFFQGYEEEQERIRYLKESYGGEYRHFDIDGKRVGYKAEENHLLVWEGNYLTRTAESRFLWREVQGQIAGMMERGVFYNRSPFGELPSENEQLSLLDFGFDLQTESKGQGVPALQPEKPHRFSLPQQIIDEMLCLGGNEPGSVGRICANYMHSRTVEENIAFLKKEFGEDGKGFVSSQGKVSVWYQDDGIHLAKGDTALNARNHMVVSWEQADRRILELLQMGRYAPQEVLDGALPDERQELAKELCYLRQDVSEGIVLLDEYFHGGFPKKSIKIAGALQDSQEREHIIEKLEEFALAYEEDTTLMRFHSHKPGALLERLKILRQEPVAFQAQGEFSEPALFISQDEMDALFINQGSGFQHGKYRIYSYFLHDHSEADCISFLKKEYGTGGMGKTWYHEDHGAKGISLSRGDLMKPYDKVSLSWKQVTSRIKRLIRKERYLSEKEIAYIPEYEKEVLSAEIYHFYYNQPEEIVRPYPQGAYDDDAVEAIVPQLEQT
ncbi:MAG: hypothetical protein K2J67_01035, partial [Lachnospiraceae bacterium]|nr:hypothetical protein [Lachnospiraceae bacterium]